jgi:hypothetical protein
MHQPEILKEVDRDKLTGWLKLAGLPLLRTAFYFEDMGFPILFVRQYLRKHKHVLLSGGRIQREIRGVNEVEFLYGLAEAMGIDTSKIAGKSSAFARTKTTASECLRVLDDANKQIDGNEQQQKDIFEELDGVKDKNACSGAKLKHQHIVVESKRY